MLPLLSTFIPNTPVRQILLNCYKLLCTKSSNGFSLSQKVKPKFLKWLFWCCLILLRSHWPSCSFWHVSGRMLPQVSTVSSAWQAYPLKSLLKCHSAQWGHPWQLDLKRHFSLPLLSTPFLGLFSSKVLIILLYHSLILFIIWFFH